MRVSGVSVPGSRELVRDWQAVLGRLELDLNPRTFDAWLRGTRPLAVEDGKLIVECQENLAIAWLNERLSYVVRRAVSAVFGEELEVEFIARGSSDRSNDAGADTACEEGSSATTSSSSREPRISDARLIGRVNRRFGLDHYVPARGNRLALNCCMAILQEDEAAPGAVAVWGGPGLGKTHLLHGVAQRALSAGWPIACLSAEDFTTRYQAALRANDVASLQANLRGVRLFILDDLQYLVRKRATQDELVHTIDAVSDAGGHVVVAGELHPLEMDLHERLTTRLSSGVVARIEPMQHAERRALVESVARRLRAALPPWALDRIAAMGDVPVRLVQGAVHSAVALQQSDLLELGRLDAEIAHLTVTEYAPAGATPDEVLEAVARHFQASVDDLRGRSRKPALANARAVAAAILQEQGRSLAEVGELLGGRNRTTLSPIVARGKRMLEAEPSLRSRLAG